MGVLFSSILTNLKATVKCVAALDLSLYLLSTVTSDRQQPHSESIEIHGFANCSIYNFCTVSVLLYGVFCRPT